MTILLDAPAVLTAEAVFDPIGLSDIGFARRWTRRALLGQPARIVDNAVLVVSELVSNALQYGGRRVTLAITVHHDRIEITVTDRGVHGQPIKQRPDDEHGRGGHIVNALAAHVQTDRAGDGTSVRAILHIEGA